MKLHRTYNIDTQTMLQNENGVNIGPVEVSAVDDIVQAVNSYEADKKLIKELAELLDKCIELSRIDEDEYFIPKVDYLRAKQIIREVQYERTDS